MIFRETSGFAAAYDCVSFSPSVMSFSPDFMRYHDFRKPNIGCFCASIDRFAGFLMVQAEFDLHNAIIKQTAKKSRMKMGSEPAKNCAAVNKDKKQPPISIDFLVRFRSMPGHYDTDFTLRTYTRATRQKRDEAAQTMASFMAQVM